MNVVKLDVDDSGATVTSQNDRAEVITPDIQEEGDVNTGLE